MSAIIKDDAILIRTYDYSESSLIAVFLTRKNGKIRFLARGAKREKSRFFGSLMTGNICELVFYYNVDRGLQTLKEIECRRSIDTGRESLARLCIFQAALEVLDRAVLERESDEGIFRLVEEFYAALPEAPDPWPPFFAFEIGLLRFTGLFPEILKCSECGRSLKGTSFRLNTPAGETACGDCASGEGKIISKSTSDALAVIIDHGPGGLGPMRLESKQRGEIGRLLHHIFSAHVEGYRLPDSLRILKRSGLN